MEINLKYFPARLEVCIWLFGFLFLIFLKRRNSKLSQPVAVFFSISFASAAFNA